MRKSKRDKLYDYVVEFLKDNSDELELIIKDFCLNVNKDDLEFIEVLSRQMCELHVAYMDRLLNFDDSLEYIRNYRNNNFLECAKLLFYAFKYVFIELEVKLTRNPKLRRTILISNRTDLSDVGYAILSSMLAYEFYPFKFIINGINYSSDNMDIIDKGNTYDYASKYMSLLLLTTDKAKFIYDPKEMYEFNIINKGIRYLENDYNKQVIISKCKTLGIIENNKQELYDYLDNKIEEPLVFDGISYDDIIDRADDNYYFYRNAYVEKFSDGEIN